jgi:co-chaperonin GroES (HSP10)
MIIPVLHRLLIKPMKVEEANETFKKMRELGLAIPESDTKKREQQAVEIGEVVAIGDTAFKDFGGEGCVKVGDRVYFAKYSGKQVKDVDGTEYILCNDEDLCAILKNNA